jgi:23S rRNA-/tRNA-specific pseudouridylate synthase
MGDDFYGGNFAERLFLHAHKLTINLPGNDRHEFSAPLPKEFKQLMSEK